MIEDDIIGTIGLVINAGTNGIVTLNDDVGGGVAPLAFTILNALQAQVFDITSNGGISITAPDIFLDGNTHTSNASTIAFNGSAIVNSPGTRTVTAGGGSINATMFDLLDGLLDLQTNTTVGTLMLDDGDVALNHTTTNVTDLIFRRGSTVSGTANVNVSNQFDAQIAVLAAAQSNWDVTGTLTLANALDHLFLAGASDSLNFRGTGNLVNNGTIDVRGVVPGDIGAIRFEAGFDITNNGTIDVNDDIAIFDDNLTPGTVTNNATIVKTGGTGESFFEMVLINVGPSGLVDVQSGELTFDVGGTGTVGATYQTGANKLALTGGHNLNGTTSITGTGTLTIGGGTIIDGTIAFSGELDVVDGGTDNINVPLTVNSIEVLDGSTLNLNAGTAIGTTLDITGTVVAPSLSSVGGAVTVIGTSTLDIDTDITFASLNMDGTTSSAGTLTGLANVTVMNTFDADTGGGGAFTIDIDVASLTIDPFSTSTINIGQNGALRFDGTAVTNNNGNWTATASHTNANITFQNGASFNNANGSNLVLDGGMDILNGGAAGGFLNDGTVTKLGTQQTDFQLVITNNDTFDIQDGRMRVTTSLANDDDIMVTGNGIFEITDGNTFVNNAIGRLLGDGEFDAPASGITNNGFAGPGISPGIMNVTGDFTFGNGSQFDVELAGSGNVAGTDYDQLAVTGTVTIDPGATLNLTTFGPYTGVTNDMFTDVIDATGALNGEFDTVLQPGSLIAQTTYVVGAPGDLSFDVVGTGVINQWTNPASGSFNAGSNWRLLSVPTTGELAFIGIGGVTVSNSVTVIVDELSLVSSSTLQLSAGTLTINNDSVLDGTLLINGGDLVGPTNLTVNGLLDWRQGTMSGAGTTTANGGVSVSTLSSVRRLNGRDLDSTATFILGQTTNFTVDSATLNQSGGIFDLRGNSSINTNGAGNVVSSVTIQKTGSFTTSIAATNLTNTGAINVNVSELVLTATGTHLETGVTATVANGTTLDMRSSTTGTYNDFDVVLVGAGTATFEMGGGGTQNYDAMSSITGTGDVDIPTTCSYLITRCVTRIFLTFLSDNTNT